MANITILKLIAEEIAKGSEINWDNWDEDMDLEFLEQEVVSEISVYEEKFDELRESDDIFDEEMMMILEDLVHNYVAAHTFLDIIQRKRKIEEVIASSI